MEKTQLARSYSVGNIGTALSFRTNTEVAESLTHSSAAVSQSRGGRPGLSGPNKPDSFCGRRGTLK